MLLDDRVDLGDVGEGRPVVERDLGTPQRAGLTEDDTRAGLLLVRPGLWDAD